MTSRRIWIPEAGEDAAACHAVRGDELLRLDEAGTPAFRENVLYGIDEFAIALADRWYREPWIRPYQQYGGIDTGGIFSRDFIYAIIRLVKETLLIREALADREVKEAVCFKRDARPAELVLDPQERRAAEILDYLNAVRGVRVRISVLPARAVPVTRGRFSAREAAKKLLERFIGTPFGCRRGRAGKAAVLFSGDLKHVEALMRGLRSADHGIVYARPGHGITPWLRLWGQAAFVKSGPKKRKLPSPVEKGLRALEARLADPPAGGSALYQYAGLDFFPLFCRKLRRSFPRLFAQAALETEDLSRFFSGNRIRLIVADEDVCPFNKLLVQAARGQGIPSAVVQHGAMGHRAGFLPLSSDRIFVWGEQDKRRLTGWGVEEDRIRVTGCARYDGYTALPRLVPRRPDSNQILFIGSPYHEPHRPDFVRGHTSKASHFSVLDVFKQLVKDYGRFEFVYKFHPRDPHRADTERYLAEEIRSGRIRAEQKAPVEPLLLGSRFAVAEWSSVCLEAILLQCPVLAVNFESEHDMFPFIADGVTAGAYDAEGFRGEFARLAAMGPGEILAWQDRMKAYAPRLNAGLEANATEKILSEIRALLT